MNDPEQFDIEQQATLLLRALDVQPTERRLDIAGLFLGIAKASGAVQAIDNVRARLQTQAQ